LFSGLLCAHVLADNPHYVILTTTNIIAQSTQLTNFVASKEARGFDVTVVSNTAAGWGGGIGDTAAENMRAWLQANYTNATGDFDINYVLLIGDPRPGSGDVPMKICWPGAATVSEQYPTDLYYAELTSDWDIDGDGKFGEWADRDTNEFPTATEVFVGRIPYYGEISDLDAILGKIVDYENTEGTNFIWRGKALIAMDGGVLLFVEWKLGDLIMNSTLNPSGWDHHRVYDYGSPETSPCTSATVLSVWTNSSFGAVFWMSHGESNGTGTDGEVIGTPEVAFLDDTHPVAAFGGSCFSAKPEATNNLAYSLLSQGGVSVFGCTRDSTYTGAETYEQMFMAPGFIYGYAKNLVHECEPSGCALAHHIVLYDPDGALSWVNYLGYNLYGCPAVGPHSVNRFVGPELAH